MKSLVIVGGGASGLMLASILKQRNVDIDIIILEKTDHVGKKILMSGNGKCNLSNINIKKESYNNEFGYEVAKSFDANYYFNTLGLLTYHDDEGRVYPYSNVSNSVLDVLRESLLDTSIITSSNVIRITKENDKYKITTDKNISYEADYLALAMGGKTYYKETNAYILSSMLSHSVTPLRPTLTSLKIKENLASIENLRSKVKATLINNNKVIYEDFGEVLYKKDALSGIVMFQLSSYIARNPMGHYEIELDLMPSFKIDEIIAMINAYPKMIGMFPKMINQYILKRANSNDSSVIAHTIKHLRFNVLENVEFKNAQVTSGGVKVDELTSNLESKYNKDLYFMGEIIDVDGICGGYNLHFAFASASVVAKDIENKVGVK